MTIGGSWGEANNASDGEDGRTWDVGVSYETGPWGFSFTYLHSEQGDGAGNDNEIDEFLLGANYDLAKGVRLAAFGIYSDQEEGAVGGAETDGFTIGTGIRVDF